MTGLEIEAYIINGTIIGCLLAKASKWLFEELQPMVVEYQKLRDLVRKVHERRIRAVPDKTVSPSKTSRQVTHSSETPSKDQSHLAA